MPSYGATLAASTTPARLSAYQGSTFGIRGWPPSFRTALATFRAKVLVSRAVSFRGCSYRRAMFAWRFRDARTSWAVVFPVCFPYAQCNACVVASHGLRHQQPVLKKKVASRNARPTTDSISMWMYQREQLCWLMISFPERFDVWRSATGLTAKSQPTWNSPLLR